MECIDQDDDCPPENHSDTKIRAADVSSVHYKKKLQGLSIWVFFVSVARDSCNCVVNGKRYAPLREQNEREPHLENIHRFNYFMAISIIKNSYHEY